MMVTVPINNTAIMYRNGALIIPNVTGIIDWRILKKNHEIPLNAAPVWLGIYIFYYSFISFCGLFFNFLAKYSYMITIYLIIFINPDIIAATSPKNLVQEKWHYFVEKLTLNKIYPVSKGKINSMKIVFGIIIFVY